jgi:nucleotide-binding universal stress UspA family protein
MSFATGLKTIVVATDLDGRSEAALEYARKLAGAYGARIVLAHGLDPLDYAAVGKVPGQVLKDLTEKARAVLGELAAGLIREGIRSHSEIRQGAVANLLVDVARQYQAGLIVVGTKGMGGAGPVVVGAVAEQLVRLAPCAVLAVAADWNAGAFRPVPGGPVLLAMERNEAAQAAVETALSLAETFQRTLLVLHARSAAEASASLDPCASSLDEFGVKPSGLFPVRCRPMWWRKPSRNTIPACWWPGSNAPAKHRDRMARLLPCWPGHACRFFAFRRKPSRPASTRRFKPQWKPISAGWARISKCPWFCRRKGRRRKRFRSASPPSVLL